MKIFWSWQSDTPGKTGRHFIRQALLHAVRELKEPDDVDEPIERDRKASLHLDHDRQGVPGSPDLFATILEKIDGCSVFVADVTPVSRIDRISTNDDDVAEKRNMNPNVAIELGYALKALGDRRILMILNAHYGDRRFLPFDLAHKAGPIMFHLPPDASKEQINAQSAALKNQVVVALRQFLSDMHNGASPTQPTAHEMERLADLLRIGHDIARRQKIMATDKEWEKDPTVGVRNEEGAMWRESVRRHIRDKHVDHPHVLEELEGVLNIQKHIFDEKFNLQHGTKLGLIDSYLNHSYRILSFLQKYG
jgi:hypothetical protein